MDWLNVFLEGVVAAADTEQATAAALLALPHEVIAVLEQPLTTEP